MWSIFMLKSKEKPPLGFSNFICHKLCGIFYSDIYGYHWDLPSKTGDGLINSHTHIDHHRNLIEYTVFAFVGKSFWVSRLHEKLFSANFHEYFLWFFFIVVPAVLGLTAAAILAVSACFCARRLRRQNKKAGHEAAFSFQPPRPPKAVRSPSGQPPQYLKKSPSPTTVKLPPGVVSPPEPTLSATRYTEEHEVAPRNTLNGAKTPDNEPMTTDTADGHEYGRLGTLVFKLRYLTERNALVVSVVRCRGLQKQLVPYFFTLIFPKTLTPPFFF